MADDSILLTDPARELAKLLTSLQGMNVTIVGSQFLAEKFEVEARSQDFYRIVATIMDRLTALKAIVAELPLDGDYRSEMVDHVNEIATAFSPTGFQNPWQAFGADKLSARNVQPLKVLSGLVRQQFTYRKLSDEELAELLGTVGELTEWLRSHQLAEQDFIRQALIEGLDHLRFRLSRFKWLGWGYTLDSLREVIAAYMLLERQGSTPQNNPDAEAVLIKVGAVIKAVYAKIETAKKVVETGDWLLKAYGAATLAQHALPAIKGLLTSS